MTSKIVKCNCVNDTQDELYGKGNRLANETRTGQCRCTVCGTLVGSQNLATITKSTTVKPAQASPAPSKKPSEKKEEKKEDKKKKSLKGGKR